MSIDELVSQLLGDDPHGLTPMFRHWFRTSRRFRTFAERYQTKIRAKLRGVSETETLQDLLFELSSARWLLQEKRFQLAYEEQGLRSAPSPDFTVSFTTKTHFYVEVTRIRATGGEETDPVALISAPLEAHQRKVLYVITGKLHQVQTGAQNLLLIGLDPHLLAGINVDEVMKQLQARSAAGDPALLTHSRLRTLGEFLKQYHALSAILFYGLAGPGPATAGATMPLLWLNNAARSPLLTQVQTILRQLPTNA